jgi:hypothetical protein
MGQALGAITGEDKGGGIGGAVTTVTSRVVIIYLISIGFIFLLLIVANISIELKIFTAEANPFVIIYNGVRGLVLFFLVFPLALGLLIGAFLIDLVVEIGFPIINGIFDAIKIGDSFPLAVINLPIKIGDDGLIGMAEELIVILKGMLDSFFPVLT